MNRDYASANSRVLDLIRALPHADHPRTHGIVTQVSLGARASALASALDRDSALDPDSARARSRAVNLALDLALTLTRALAITSLRWVASPSTTT
ncbi:hypothetical protein BBK82_44065 [Lentzea guizhouensis]|uniref:Uncharacterized protein n=1 Tax=Lentzea guizhouensis TaxID=1586287 RepID=A0A1B2HVV5_9PSEU|nr:hypothetical protein BBK82_44065 [Lentzea guizhouensis]